MQNDTNAPDVGNKDGFNGGAIQHTPGPWTAQFEEGEVPGTAATEIDYQGSCIARVYGSDDFPCLVPSDDVDAQLAANARLIAAAPDLLEALKNLLTLSENADETGYVEGEGWLPMETIQERARAAIAKATEPSR